MSEDKKPTLFNIVFAYLVENFNIKAKSICEYYAKHYGESMITISESALSNYKTISNPRDQDLKYLLEAVENYLAENIYYSKKSQEDFLNDMKEIFLQYDLLIIFEKISGKVQEYAKLIVDFLDAAYKGKDRDVESIENKSITATEAIDKGVPKDIKKIVVFDLDGTLIKGIKYSWTLLYQVANVSTEKCKLKKREFENGEISYPEWVAFDYQELKAGGLTKEMAQKATRKNCSLTVNFRQAIDKLKSNGCAVGIISGGADVVLYSLIPDADELFDNNIYINRLKFNDEGMLNDIEATPYDWDDDGKVRGVQGKNEGLKKMCNKYGLSLEDAVFVGDDDNDFKAMRLAGTKILYHSCDPNDTTYGTGSRSIPDGVRFVMKNDLLLVADIILGDK